MEQLTQSRKTRYTRMALKDSLMELMQLKPISRITIKELCENADINRTTFYAHYLDQYDLLDKLEQETLSWAKDAIKGFKGKTDAHELLDVLESIIQYFADNQNHMRVLMSEQGDIAFQKQIFTLVYEQCGITPDEAQKENADAQKLNFIFIVNGSVGLIQDWLKNGLTTPVRLITETIYNMASCMVPLP